MFITEALNELFVGLFMPIAMLLFIANELVYIKDILSLVDLCIEQLSSVDTRMEFALYEERLMSNNGSTMDKELTGNKPYPTRRVL